MCLRSKFCDAAVCSTMCAALNLVMASRPKASHSVLVPLANGQPGLQRGERSLHRHGLASFGLLFHQSSPWVSQELAEFGPYLVDVEPSSAVSGPTIGRAWSIPDRIRSPAGTH